MIRSFSSWLSFFIAVFFLAAASASGATPQIVSHQGYLSSSAGLPMTGNHSLTFAIYDIAVGGAALWSETHATVAVSDGLYTVLLGSVTPFSGSVFAGPGRYLGISIDGGPELTPRRQIAASPYAISSDRSANSDSLNGQPPSFYQSWANLTGIPAGFADGVDNTGTGDITAITAGEGLAGGGTSGAVNIYLDTAGVASKNILNGTIVNEDVAAAAAIAITKIAGTAVNLNTAQTITAQKTFDGTVYFGDSTMRIDNNGIRIGSSLAPSATYMLLLDRHVTTASTHYGVFSDLDNTTTGTVYGIYGRASSETPGEANSGNVYGIYGLGISDGLERYGAYVAGRARSSTNRTGDTYGLVAEARYGLQAFGVNVHAYDATSATGVYTEIENSNSGTGSYTYVHDNTASSSAIGTTNLVLSNAGNAFGVAGTAGSNSGVGYGVYGTAYGNSTNWAGYFTGDVNVAGTIYMPAKITKIDHPLDPENQNLLLAGIDSPEMLVKTSGNVTTDASGIAVVTLPEYFSAVAGNFRYQLTVIGEFAQAIIGDELAGNHFSIKTDKPNIKVSWEITGERIDNFAKANRLTPESAKTADQRGRYLHPAAFGQPTERGVDYPTIQELTRVTPQRRTTVPPDGSDE